MSRATRKKKDPMPATPPGVLAWRRADGLQDIADVAERLRAAIESATPLVIDLSGAGDPDSPFVQLLISASRAGDAFVLRDPSPAFVDGCSALGLFSVLMAMPMETSA
jgi:hypothetical protein